jgi:hypothetical protein
MRLRGFSLRLRLSEAEVWTLLCRDTCARLSAAGSRQHYHTLLVSMKTRGKFEACASIRIRRGGFEDHRVLIERGKEVFIAAVTTARAPQRVAARLRKALAEVEAEFGDVL